MSDRPTSAALTADEMTTSMRRLVDGQTSVSALVVTASPLLSSGLLTQSPSLFAALFVIGVLLLSTQLFFTLWLGARAEGTVMYYRWLKDGGVITEIEYRQHARPYMNAEIKYKRSANGCFGWGLIFVTLGGLGATVWAVQWYSPDPPTPYVERSGL